MDYWEIVHYRWIRKSSSEQCSLRTYITYDVGDVLLHRTNVSLGLWTKLGKDESDPLSSLFYGGELSQLYPQRGTKQKRWQEVGMAGSTPLTKRWHPNPHGPLDTSAARIVTSLWRTWSKFMGSGASVCRVSAELSDSGVHLIYPFVTTSDVYPRPVSCKDF